MIICWRNGNCSPSPVDNGVCGFQPGMSKDCVFFSPIHDEEADFLSDSPNLNKD